MVSWATRVAISRPICYSSARCEAIRGWVSYAVHNLATQTDDRRVAGAARADRRRQWRTARMLDRDVGEGAGVDAREALRAAGGGHDRRGRQPVGHAARALRACTADRRAYRLSAERRLARRLLERRRGA